MWRTQFSGQGPYCYTLSRKNPEAHIHAHTVGHQHGSTDLDSNCHGYTPSDKHTYATHQHPRTATVGTASRHISTANADSCAADGDYAAAAYHDAAYCSATYYGAAYHSAIYYGAAYSTFGGQACRWHPWCLWPRGGP